MKFKTKLAQVGITKIFTILGIILMTLTLVSALFIQTLTQSNFDEGTYNQTYYNTTNNATQINLSYDSGNYTSKVFDMGSPVSWDNLSWHEQRIQCPEGMAYINKLDGFCIDKYEASCWNSDGTFNTTSNTSTWNSGTWTDSALEANAYANSSEGKYPWVYIDQTEARTACSNAGKHLCTDKEWLAAVNIKGQVYNLPAEITDCTINEATDCDWASAPGGGDACITGSKTDCVSSEGVYDMVGNVREWTNETVDVTTPASGSGWKYINTTDMTWSTSSSADDGTYGKDGCYFPSASPSGRAVSRGGYWGGGADAGPFCTILLYDPTLTHYYIGFRCCSS